MDPSHPLSSCVNIHESLSNNDRIAYLKKKCLTADGHVGLSTNILQGIKNLQYTFKAQVVSSSLMVSELHITFQDDFMRSRLLDKDPVFGRSIGGIVTDSTYSFFKNGYLTTSSVYCRMLQRWIPVLFTYSENLDKCIFKAHFLGLIGVIRCCEDGQEELLAQVRSVHFAYCKTKLTKEKGCRFQFSSTQWIH